MSDADTEAAETTVWLDFAAHFGYLSESEHGELTDHYSHICSQLALMMEQPEKWAPRTRNT